MASLKNLRIRGKLLVPTIALLVVTIAGAVVYISKATTKNAVDNAIYNSEKIVNQFKTIRAYYTNNVISKIKKNTDLEVSFDHETEADTVPLPATMIHDVSALLAEDADGVQLRLYSDFPFPNRAGRVLDDFATEALSAAKADPETSFVKRDVLGGREVVRVAVADTMVSDACVGCHNSHAQTPKNNWRLGDVRGVLEVITPIDNVLAANGVMITKTAALLSAITVAIILILSYIVRTTVTRPVAKVIEYFREGQRDLTRRLDINSSDEVGELGRWYNHYMDQLEGIIARIRSSTNHLASSSEELSASSTQIAQGAEEQSSRASQVSTASQQMSATLAEVARNVNSASETAGEANTVAVKGGEAVTRTIERMNGIAATARQSSEIISGLGGRSDEIGNIVNVIDDIADQTNLLALNAAIEAARAGEQGRGFAVVADEVRKLAEKTMSATKEIGGMIRAMQDETSRAISSAEEEVRVVNDGVELAAEAGRHLDEIVSKVEGVTNMVSQIATASQQQSTATDQITGDMESIASVTSQTSTSARQIAAATHEISDLASELKNMVSEFKVSGSTRGSDPSPAAGADNVVDIGARKAG